MAGLLIPMKPGVIGPVCALAGTEPETVATKMKLAEKFLVSAEDARCHTSIQTGGQCITSPLQRTTYSSNSKSTGLFAADTKFVHRDVELAETLHLKVALTLKDVSLF